MKSLEETIKQKCKFLGNIEVPYALYNLPVSNFLTNKLDLFVSNDNVKSNNSITLLEEMTPLVIYIFSCIIYNGHHFDFDNITIKIVFEQSEITLNNFICLDQSFLFDSPVQLINESIEQIKNSEHYVSFLNSFRFEIWIDVETFIEEEEEEEEKEEPININELKTFKIEECVICLENKNNVLFCNCGHICVCDKCIVLKKLSKCPVCKTENTILRVIE